MGNSSSTYTEELHSLHNSIHDKVMAMTDVFNGFYDTMKELNDGESIFANTEAINTSMYFRDMQYFKYPNTIPYAERHACILLDVNNIVDKLDKLDAMVIFIKKPMIDDNVQCIVTDISPGNPNLIKPQINDSMSEKDKHKVIYDSLNEIFTVIDNKIKFLKRETEFLIKTFKLARHLDDMDDMDDSSDGEDIEDIAQVSLRTTSCTPSMVSSVPPSYTASVTTK